MAGLTSTDSPLMRNARASGLAQANRRGLVNSSIAGQASETAALAAATPIASQEAAQAATANTAWGTNKASLASNERNTAAQIASDEKTKFATLAAQDRQAQADAIARLNDTYTGGIGNTLQNDKIPAATRSAAQRDIANLYTTSIARMRALYNYSPAW
ncbi:hypothetical protein KFK14_12990 [Sphingobium phenoxybenzoativorans]|uniref:Uncharacterized protein n=1 Tax=Sphingobium phenoxybenzoativorans TaxID=1592790 RepID=A0A975Q061_9SPHN|nr:hypothetical protein [Sphingobium phenoxybenzoativorans]QUT04063.1 hypothetical protein KFK14_12990 [Sphingobium phenoxybenzoativorans]